MRYINKMIRKLNKIDDFDYATIGSVVLGIGDITWLIHDILKNGFIGNYVVIALMFLIGNIILIVGFQIHSKNIKELKAKRIRQRNSHKLSEAELSREAVQYE